MHSSLMKVSTTDLSKSLLAKPTLMGFLFEMNSKFMRFSVSSSSERLIADPALVGSLIEMNSQFMRVSVLTQSKRLGTIPTFERFLYEMISSLVSLLDGFFVEVDRTYLFMDICFPLLLYATSLHLHVQY